MILILPKPHLVYTREDYNSIMKYKAYLAPSLHAALASVSKCHPRSIYTEIDADLLSILEILKPWQDLLQFLQTDFVSALPPHPLPARASWNFQWGGMETA
jgi:hypothetical protein